MGHPVRVAIVDGGHYLHEKVAADSFVEAPVLGNKVEKFAALDKLKSNKVPNFDRLIRFHPFGILLILNHVDDIVVFQLLEHGYLFMESSLEVWRHVVVENLDGTCLPIIRRFR